MLHKLKPVPRGLLILAIVGGLGYAALQMDLTKVLPKKEAVELTVPITVVSPVATPATAAVVAPVEAAPAMGGLTAAPVPDAGLDAVLGAGKKKN
jgi:hypothetical protein